MKIIQLAAGEWERPQSFTASDIIGGLKRSMSVGSRPADYQMTLHHWGIRNVDITGMRVSDSKNRLILCRSVLGPEFEDRYNTVESRLEFWAALSTVFGLDTAPRQVPGSTIHVQSLLYLMTAHTTSLENIDVKSVVSAVLVTDRLLGGAFFRAQVKVLTRKAVQEVVRELRCEEQESHIMSYLTYGLKYEACEDMGYFTELIRTRMGKP